MEIVLNILNVLMWFLIDFLLPVFIGIIILLLILTIIPIAYEFDVKANNSAVSVFCKISFLLGIIKIEVLNDYRVLIILGIFKIKLREDLANEIDDSFEYEDSKESWNENKGIFRRIKIAIYKFEAAIKEIIYKFKKTINNINEYKYKMDLFRKTVESIQKLIKILKPKKATIDIEFGTGNRAITGKLIGALSILSVKYNNVNITPDFEKATLKFETNMQGRIMPIKAIILMIKFVCSKPVRKIYSRKRR